MEKKHIITITGDHASGQSMLSKSLQEEFGYEIYRNGQYARKLAKEMGMTITEFQVFLNENPEMDRKIEKSASEYANNHDNLIIDAKLGWFAVPYSFKIYLKVDIDMAAKRAYNDKNRKDTEPFNSVEEAKKLIQYRYEQENKRWFNEYNIKREDMSNYDLVVDTTNLTTEDVFNIVKEEYKKWLEK